MNWLYVLSKTLFRWGCRLFFRASVSGLENVPTEGGVVLTSNHASHLDPLMMGIFVPRRCWYVARLTLTRLPLIGAWMRAIGVIFIDRKSPSREALGRAIGCLQRGEIVGYFPEGTRSPDGKVQEFHKGLLLLLKKSDASVVPVGIEGSFSAFPKGAYLPRPRRVTVRYGRARTAAEVLAPGGLGALRHEVAELSRSELA